MSWLLGRRALLKHVGAAVAAAGALGRFPGRAWAATPIQAGPSPRDPKRLVALPGKRPLIQVYDKPPVYETPTGALIGHEIYPLTDRDAYYVRWREANIPVIRPEDVRVEVAGDAAVHPRTFTLEELKQFEEISVAAVGACKGNARGTLRPLLPGIPWGKGDVSAAKWTGIRMRDLLQAVGVKDNAVQVAFKSAGQTVASAAPEYWRIQSVDELMKPDALLAYKMNDGEIPIWNGAPLRLVVPGEYAPEWVKQVVRIEIRSTPIDNVWAGTKAGPDPLRIVSFITTPEDGTVLHAGQETELSGVAYDSGIGIAKVEVSTDGGRTWHRAALEPSYGKYVWRVWHYRLIPKQPGKLTVLTRATDVNGTTQPFEPLDEHVATGGRRLNSVLEYAGYLEVA